MRRLSRIPLLLAAIALSACSDAGSGGSENGAVVARAADQKLSVVDAAALVAPRTDLPAQKEVIRTLANLWTDYTLLATAATADSTMAQVDVSGIVNEVVEERILRTLRDSVIRFTPIPAAEVKTRYAREGPGSIVQARQIVFAWPDGATPAQKDSVRRALVDLRGRITEKGEDFAEAAKVQSQDPATAPRGGAMGLVTRGQLVAPLEQAVFSLRVGEVSQPIESPYGLHLVKVEARTTPTMEQFRMALINRSAAAAESVYVAGLEKESKPEIVAGAPGIVRTLARDPRFEAGRGDARALLKYPRGEITQGEVLRHLQKQAPELRNQIAKSADDSIPARLLLSLAHRELLLADAERRGFVMRKDVQDGLTAAARRNLADAARQLGLMPVKGDSARTVPKSVLILLSNMLTGQQREVTPLGAMSYALRARYPSSMFDDGLDSAVVRVEQARRAAPGAPAQKD
jgi:parvulin-like peptidyl-prolyl isomerase